MKKFAKLYRTKEFGQILVVADPEYAGTEDEVVTLEFINSMGGGCLINIVDSDGDLPGFSRLILKNMTKARALEYARAAEEQSRASAQMKEYIQALEGDQ